MQFLLPHKKTWNRLFAFLLALCYVATSVIIVSSHADHHEEEAHEHVETLCHNIIYHGLDAPCPHKTHADEGEDFCLACHTAPNSSPKHIRYFKHKVAANEKAKTLTPLFECPSIGITAEPKLRGPPAKV